MEKPKYRYLGGYTPRKDAREIVNGSAVFLDDFQNLKNMLYAKVLTSPYAHARIKSIDTSRAEAYPGVVKVLTHWNMPEFCKDWRRGCPPTKELLGEKVLYVGDCVAIVCGESVDIVREALRLIKVEYEVLPAVFDFHEALADGAPTLYDDPRYDGNRLDLDNTNTGEFGEEMLYRVQRGDVDKAFAECDAQGGGECVFESWAVPLAPEPPGMIGTYDPISDKYFTYSTTQLSKTKVVELRKVPPTTIIEGQGFNVGGSYGNKQAMTMQLFVCLIMARLTGRPVKYMMSKEEQFTIHEVRIGSRMNMQFAMKDGIVTGVKGRWGCTPGMSNLAATCILGTGLGEMQLALGKCKNWDIETDVVVTNKMPCGVVRGYGGQELKSTMMPLVADCMRAANIDPIEFYKNNFVGFGDGYYWRDSKWYNCLVDYKEAIQQSADKFGWKDKWKGWFVPTAVNGPKRIGVGASIHGNADVGEDLSEAQVTLRNNGLVCLHVMTNEFGNGQRSSLCKMAAEILNVDYDKVILSNNNTIENPEDFGLAGSRGTLTLGSAVVNAAEDAKQKLFQKAAPKLRCLPSDLETRDGVVYVKGQPERCLTWFEAIGFLRSIDGKGQYDVDYSQPNFVIDIVEVEVDIETGETKVLKFFTGTDVGQVIDCKACEMQLQGGIGAAALDTGVFEESVLDRYTGRIMTHNLIDYKWRPFNEFPEFDDLVLEGQPNISKLRAVGIGEISGAPGAAAISMAISNAIGKRYAEYPATPARILKALKED